MRSYKKILTGAVCGAFLLTVLGGLTACGMFNGNIADTVENSVTYPEQYSITYEAEDENGAVRTVTKTVDADGNIYFASGETEKLFVKDGDMYRLYQRDVDGEFVAADGQTAYEQETVDSETSEFASFAEQSKNQFIPGMESSGEEEVLGRTCYVYGVKIGSDNNGISYAFYVDKETGICLGFESSMSAAGVALGADGEAFACTEFLTEEIPTLTELLPEEY